MSKYSNALIDKLEAELPEFFTRAMIAKRMKGVLAYQTLSNYETKGIGPPIYYLRDRACYLRSEFIDWLRENTRRADEFHHRTGRKVCRRKGLASDAGGESEGVEGGSRA